MKKMSQFPKIQKLKLLISDHSDQLRDNLRYITLNLYRFNLLVVDNNLKP